jgi:hypothetical protein
LTGDCASDAVVAKQAITTIPTINPRRQAARRHAVLEAKARSAGFSQRIGVLRSAKAPGLDLKANKHVMTRILA